MGTRERDDRRVFAGLDGLRGVAALFVAMRHTAFFHNLGVHGGYLAVDLFFVLSGFVIAHAYERRLARGLSAARFLAMRYLRLWPVYALGGTIGVAAALAHALPGRDNLTPDQVMHTAPFALMMLPGPPIKEMLYPINSVAWSLALELLVNLAYAALWRPLRDPRLLAGAVVASALWLIGAVLWFGKLDIGFMWSDAAGGLPRVAFSFTAGLALHRLLAARSWRSPLPLSGPMAAWVPILALAPLLYVRLDEIVWPLACVLVLFPALVTLSAASQANAFATRTFAALGAMSYPLYALHKPIGELVTLGVRHVAPHAVRNAGVGALYLAALAILCALVERWYDRPVRRALSGWLDAVTGRRSGSGVRPPRAEAPSGALAADA